MPVEPGGYIYEPEDNVYIHDEPEEDELNAYDDHSQNNPPAVEDEQALKPAIKPGGKRLMPLKGGDDEPTRPTTRRVPLKGDDGGLSSSNHSSVSTRKKKPVRDDIGASSHSAISRSGRSGTSRRQGSDVIDETSDRSGRSARSVSRTRYGRRTSETIMEDKSSRSYTPRRDTVQRSGSNRYLDASGRSNASRPYNASGGGGGEPRRQSMMRAGSNRYMNDDLGRSNRSRNDDLGRSSRHGVDDSRRSSIVRAGSRRQLDDSRRSTVSRQQRPLDDSRRSTVSRQQRPLDDSRRSTVSRQQRPLDDSRRSTRGRALDDSRRSTASRSIRPGSQSRYADYDEEASYGGKSFQSESTKGTHRSNKSSGGAAGALKLGITICMCCVCLLLVAGGVGIAFYFLYWEPNQDDSGDGGSNIDADGNAVDPSKPPDFGKEFLYAINAYTITYTPDDVTVTYKISDYILDGSVDYRLYDTADCREGEEITDRSYLFVNVIKDEVPQGDGTLGRFIDVNLKPNFFTISGSSIYAEQNFREAIVSVCLGFTVIYNQVEWWVNQELEVNYVETWIEVDLDRQDFNAITAVRQSTVTAPQYKR